MPHSSGFLRLDLPVVEQCARTPPRLRSFKPIAGRTAAASIARRSEIGLATTVKDKPAREGFERIQ